MPRALSVMSARVQGLGEAGVDDPHRPALGREPLGDLDAAHHDGPEAHDEQLGAHAEGLRLAHRDEDRVDVRQVQSGIPGVVQRERMILGECRPQQAAQLLLVAG